MSHGKTLGKARGKATGIVERPYSLVDVVIFTVRNDRLHVLLVTRPDDPSDPFPGRWALPGGFIDVAKDGDLEAAARRKLKEKTGVTSGYLEQLGSFGSRDRDPRGWSVTTVYFALIPSQNVTLVTGGNAEGAEWFPVGRRKMVDVPLAFDHKDLLEAALLRLRNKVEYTSLPVHLLGGDFTLPELQRTFEVVLGREVDKSAFRTRVLSAGFLEPTGESRTDTNRPALLYRLVKGKEAVVFPRTFYAKK